MKTKLIVTDLDRTLLRTDKTISHYTADILKTCVNMGIKVAFASARPLRTVKHFLTNVPTDAVILHNGAVIYIDNRQVFHCGIDSRTTRNILSTIIRACPEATLSVEIDDVFYANFDVSIVWNYTEAIFIDFQNIHDSHALPDKPAEKIIVGVTSMADIERLSKYLPDNLYIEMSDNRLGLIMNRGATKYRAINYIARYYDCGADEIIAFGDDYNDLEMIRYCGIGVAMANALDDIKNVADFICDSNDNDGVAKWIEQKIIPLHSKLR